MPAAMCLLALCSCVGDTVYHNYVYVDIWGWNNADTVTFVLPEMTVTGEMDVNICVRATSSFDYKTLHLLATISCDNEYLESDTLYIPIYDGKGRPTGKGFPYSTIVKPMPALHVDSGHVYSFCILHTMHEAEVEGITSIGLELKSKR